MGYKVKWVEENLGVSRKALRGFEKFGLMPPNENGGYRDYSDEDINRIWSIRVQQGMGYSLKEISAIAEDENFDFDESLAEKVKQLEKEKAEVEKHLGYAKTIKLTGRFPSRPKEMGTVKFDEFYEKALNEWNINDTPQTQQYQEIADMILSQSEYEWKESDLGKLFRFLENLKEQSLNWEAYMVEQILPKAIISRSSLGAGDPEVQLLVKMMYENRENISPEMKAMTVNQFVRFESSSYIVGDVARLKERDYGKEGCQFMADAIAIFGGYKDYSEVED